MHNGNVVVHTTYEQFFYMLYEQKVSVHTTYRQLVHMLYGRELYVHTTYKQIFHMLYRQNILSIQHTEKFSICCMDDYITIVYLLEITE